MRARTRARPARLRAVLGCLGFAVALTPPMGALQAHPELVANRVNRYVTATLIADRLELSLALLYGDVPAEDERRRLDADGNGRLSDAEITAAEHYYRETTASLLAASVAGRPISADQATVAIVLDLAGERSTSARPFVVERRERHRIERAPLELGLSPEGTLPMLGETELGVVLGPDWRLLHSQLGTAPPGKALVFKLQGNDAKGARFTLLPAGADSPASSTGRTETAGPSGLLWFFALAGLALAVLVGWRGLRRQ